MFAQQRALFSARIFVTNIPAEWDQNEISSRFSIVGKAQAVHLVKN